MKQSQYGSSIFKLSLRFSVLFGFAISPFLFSFFSFQFTLNKSLVLTSMFLLLSGIVVYGIANYLLKERIERLILDLHRIRLKQFDDIERSYEDSNDELDRLTKQVIITSETIEKEIKRLKKIENYRKEFIGDVSHELKTPIFAVQGFIETLLDGAIDDEEVNRRFLKKAQKNVNRLIYLTNDLMEISRLETGEMKIKFEEFNLVTTIYEIIENLQYKAEQEDVLLEMQTIDDRLRVMADRNQIKQILTNLIENAIKYNLDGGKVIVSAKPYPNRPSKVLVQVRDSGIGIDKKDLKRVTERFFRVDKSRSREKGGTGLGLSIVKHTIEAHGEELFIESEPGKGSLFSFTLQNAEMMDDLV